MSRIIQTTFNSLSEASLKEIHPIKIRKVLSLNLFFQSLFIQPSESSCMRKTWKKSFRRFKITFSNAFIPNSLKLPSKKFFQLRFGKFSLLTCFSNLSSSNLPNLPHEKNLEEKLRKVQDNIQQCLHPQFTEASLKEIHPIKIRKVLSLNLLFQSFFIQPSESSCMRKTWKKSFGRFKITFSNAIIPNSCFSLHFITPRQVAASQV